MTKKPQKKNASQEAGGTEDVKADSVKESVDSGLEPTEVEETRDGAGATQANEAEEGEDDGKDTASTSNKKKKKKPKAKAPPAQPEVKPKKIPAHLAALQKQLEQQRLLEAEKKREEEEERLRLEEEERMAAEEERRKEEAKERKKQKEKQKREELRAQGKLLSKKQKEQQALAQRRMQQLIDSGVTVEGLNAHKEDLGKNKKPTYGKKKKLTSQSIRSAPLMKDQEPKKEHTNGTVTELSERSISEDEIDGEEYAKEQEVVEDDPLKDSWEVSSDMAESDRDGNRDTSPLKSSRNAIHMAILPNADSENTEIIETRKETPLANSASVSSSPAIAAVKTEVDQPSKESEAAEGKYPEAKHTRDKPSARAYKGNLRSPICCILGHVDTGKTKLLDKIRQTNVQEGEAGGITQQIGATYFPVEVIKAKTAVLNKAGTQEYKAPGLLVIDTPGHESFTNLRSRGSSLCNIAILVVDIMHGLEPQTLESLRLLKARKTPFVVALNKIDRLYGWEPTRDGAFRESLAKQKKSVQREFGDRLEKTILAFAEQGLNAVLYYENKSFARNVSLVPTSAVTGEGVPDMLMLLVNLTQERMSDKLLYLSKLECTVLEVKVIEGLGTTIDAILSNGILREGDRIVLCGMNGPIATNVRALLTPQPLRELRIKSAYVHHKEVKAAQGVKISAHDLDKAVAGSRLLVAAPGSDEAELKTEVMADLQNLLGSVDKSGKGVSVQASTLGSLEALLEFLKQSKIPVSSINIGPIYKKDIMRTATMLERSKEHAVMLCFDVKVDKEAEQLADELGIKIFSADIIYHLFDAFTAYQNEIMATKRKDQAGQAVFPCVLKTIAVFNKKDPIILGVDIMEGSLRVGTPICAIKQEPESNIKQVLQLGKVTSLEVNHKSMDVIKKGQAWGGVAVKIEGSSQPLYGRHIDESDILYSHISRATIDTLKDPVFRQDVTNEEWKLIVQLKKTFDIN